MNIIMVIRLLEHQALEYSNMNIAFELTQRWLKE